MKFINIVIGLVILIIIVAGMGFWFFTRSLKAPDSTDDAHEVVFEIESGQGVNQVSANLKEAGLIKTTWAFEWYVWLEGLSSKILAGTYSLKTDQSIESIVDIITLGDTDSNIETFKVTEGWTALQIAEHYAEIFSNNLNKDGEALIKDFINTVSESDSRNIIPGETYDFIVDKPASASLEGYLFPDTYFVYDDATPAQIIQKMLDNFDLKLDDDIRTKIKNSSLSIFETVTLASIVEKEVDIYEDRQKVADLFLRRIDAGMPLQSDATVNYVTGKDALQPTINDTKVESLYNTYLHTGLPPGPICNPSLSSIAAVANSEPNEYWYYLNAPDGQTIFSKTFEEHKLNKAKYLN